MSLLPSAAAVSAMNILSHRLSTLLSASSRPRKAIGWCAALYLVAVVSSPPTAAAFQLVTPEEAALPASGTPVPQLRGSPTRRPVVTVVRPARNTGVIRSPLDFKLRFRAFGGAAIDPESVIVTYLKEPAIDITQRIARFITADGIDISPAELPPGTHQFWVELRDNEGRIGGTEIEFQVAQ
jgi:hypothetical protein